MLTLPRVYKCMKNPSGSNTYWFSDVSVMKMVLSGGIIFLTGFVLAIAYGKKHKYNLIDNNDFLCF